ncbi:cupin domain-containing protein [Polaromonas sp. C04]|uniref:cupin domain-containing protein n=1 Tax=Polaromonas sp. C04 TaxID=1945857 RepID=UPI000987C76D|nr:cupin domain-containing protein [Polaromonas sp. C04]OOG50830.1 cupin [Polaromonas sp. C04]
MRRLSLLVAVAAAFSAGLFSARWVPTATAQSDVPLVPMIIHVTQLSDNDIGPPLPGLDLRSHTYVSRPGATVAVQSGNVFKHYHSGSDEIQYIVEGSGTFWLGDKQQQIGPGDLIIIPKGTVHAGSMATTGRFKAIAIKTPPQAADDTHRVD